MTIPHFLWECDEVKVKQNVLKNFVSNKLIKLPLLKVTKLTYRKQVKNTVAVLAI